MSKMTVIQLLNKIANGEEVPKKIKYNTRTWYYKEGIMEYISENDCFSLSNFEFNQLNDEVEIIEEDKKMEKIEYSIDKDGYLSVNDFREHLLQIINKINEIIDYINGGTNGE